MSDMKTSIFNRFGKFFGLGAPKPRGEIRFVDYREGDRLIRRTPKREYMNLWPVSCENEWEWRMA